MTLEQIRIFLAVCESLNMTRSAERLNLSQPAVSAAIAALEGRYGTKLFDRVGRRLELSEAGRLFLPEVKAVLARVDEARGVLEDLAGLERGTVRMAASQTVATYWLPRRMARFARTAPKIGLHLTVGNTAQAVGQLMQGDADIAVVEGEVTEPLLSHRIVGGDRIGLYAGRDHGFVGRDLTVDDLRGAVWVMRERGSGTRDHLAAGLAMHDIAIDALTTPLELSSNGAVLEAIEEGGLIAAVSELAAASRVEAGRVQPLRWALPQRKFTLLQHRSRRPSRAVLAFTSSLDGQPG